METPIAKVRCPQCESRLDILETPSGGRIVSVSLLGPAVDSTAQAVEAFQGPDDRPEIVCPACMMKFDPSEPGSAVRPPRYLHRRA